MSDTASNDNIIRKRKILLAWFTAASATYLDLGLTAGQLMYLYLNCSDIAREHTDSKLHFFCTCALNMLNTPNFSDSEECREKEYRDKEAKMIDYIKLAHTHLQKKQYGKAMPYSRKCLAIAQESGDEKGQMIALLTLANAHLGKEEYDDAISCNEKCLAIAQKSGDKESKMSAYSTLSLVHLKKKEYDSVILNAKKYFATVQESVDEVAEMNAYKTSEVCQMNVYMWLGIALYYKKEYDDSILYAKKCLAFAQDSGNKVAQIDPYLTLGNAHLMINKYDDAILYSKECLAIAQESGHKVSEMNACLTLANAHSKKEQYDEALLWSQKCLNICIAQESDDKVTEMNAYMILGNAHLQKKEYHDAILYSEKCLAIAQKSGDKVIEMSAYTTLGNAHIQKKIAQYHNDAMLWDTHALGNVHLLGNAQSSKEEYDDAILCGEKSLAIALESGDKVAGMKACTLLGNVHLLKKEYDVVVLYGRKCLAIAQKTSDKVSEMKARILLGNAHLSKEELDDAILHGEKGLAIALESGDKAAEKYAYRTLVNAHFKKNELDDTVLYSERYLAIAQESGCKVNEMNAYWMLGFAHSQKEEYDDAHSCFSECRTIARDLEDHDYISCSSLMLDTIHQAVGLTEGFEDFRSTAAFKRLVDFSMKKNQRSCQYHECFMLFIYHRAQHEYEKAISCLKETMAAVSQQLDISSTQRNTMYYRELSWLCKQGMSEMYVLLGQYEEGMHCSQEALDIARKEGTKSKQAISHCSLGELYYKLQQFEKAEESLKESLKCYEPIFESLKQNDRFKIAFADNQKKAYKMLLKVLIETDKKEEALVLSDHYRAKALKDLLVSSYGMKKEQIAKEGLQYADVQSLVSSSKYTLLFYSTCFEKLCTFLVEAGNELEFFVQYFEYCDACLDKLVDKTFDDMKVRQIVNCEDRSVVVVDDMEENKNREKDELAQLLARQKEKRSSEQCRSICGCRGNPSESSDDSSLTSGLEILYHKLIHNIKCLIKQDEIVIFPEGPLYKVPFAALRNPDTGQYLSETKRIRMAPSMASLKLLQECPVKHHSSKDALIIGGPLARGVMMDGKVKDFDVLEGALNEAVDIAFILGVRPLLAADATKPTVIKKLQGASVVHIAAHGNLEKATIVLAPSPDIIDSRIPDEEDYMLTMADVQAIQVRAQLVVLSCCHSGRGQIKAEGVVGMCRAFLASGARAVLGSLWAVDDHATRKFMETFYTHLKDGNSASTSLHLTMKDMRRMPQYSEPKYWAPFFLIGDDVTIQFED